MRTLIMAILAGLILAACAPAGSPVESTVAAVIEDVAEQGAGTEAGPQVTEVAGEADLAATAPGHAEGAGPVIVFKRGGGLTGESQEWLIYADGTVQSADGTQRAVAPAEVSALLAGLEGLGFFEMQDAYGVDSQCADCFRYEITVTHDGQKKTVTTIDAAGDAPAELGQVLDQIQKVIAG
jgi:hypothetical protein